MSYNINELPKYIHTAGKITIATAFLGVVVFAVIFLLNIGAKELAQVEAQSGLATTSVTVLNTPPTWTIDAQELTESSTSTPTNSGSAVTWVATATDSNNEDYYLLICDGSTAAVATSSNPPSCGGTDKQWAVSALTNSGSQATAATTTIDRSVAGNPFAETNNWYAWVCDAVAVNPRCNTVFKQGTGTTSSPFVVNSRPNFTIFTDDSPADPGALVTFHSTSSDDDTLGGADTVALWVCATNSFNSTSSLGCNGTFLASSTLAASDPSATYTIQIPTPDQNYAAYGFVVDNHNHEASGGSHGTDSVLTVNNVAPFVTAGVMDLNNSSDIVLTQNAGETTGITLQYEVDDYNSCQNAAAGDEVTDYIISVYRSGIGSSTCDGTTLANYNPNNCYTTAAPTTTWNISCTASSTSCSGTTDRFQVWNCTFPLWYIADPTDGGSATTSPFFAEDWRAAVSAIDDDGATTSVHTEGSIGQELRSFMYMALDTLSIPYGELEPGQYSSPTITASTTVRSEGNIGLDERLTGEAMCGTYTTAVKCLNSATSTIPESEQVFATSTVTYGFASSSGNTLSSTSQKFLDLNVPKSISTTTATSAVTYWGIRVPGTITLAGAYTGENTFYAVPSDASQW